jgi:hypothetical protein
VQYAINATLVLVPVVRVRAEVVDNSYSALDWDRKAFARPVQILPEIWRQDAALESGEIGLLV